MLRKIIAFVKWLLDYIDNILQKQENKQTQAEEELKEEIKQKEDQINEEAEKERLPADASADDVADWYNRHFGVREDDDEPHRP